MQMMYLVVHDLPLEYAVDMEKFRLILLLSIEEGKILGHPTNGMK
jgi:hypothetical protein